MLLIMNKSNECLYLKIELKYLFKLWRLQNELASYSLIEIIK